MELWDSETLNLEESASIKVGSDGTGLLRFIAVAGTVDCRFKRGGGVQAVEFSWEGHDDGRPVSGRGEASLLGSGELKGRIYFHLGDDSSFVARRSEIGEV